MKNVTTTILAAAGTATGQLLVDNWERIWSLLQLSIMRPPSFIHRTPDGKVDVRIRVDGGYFIDAFCERIDDQVVVEGLVRLAKSQPEIS